MAVTLNKELQAFSDAIDHHGDDARVTLMGDGIGADTDDIGLFSRIFRPKASAQQIRENNEVRTALLNALSAQYGGSGKIPQSVLDALNGSSLRGKSDMSASNGVKVSSGRPLTVRRIRAILEQVRLAPEGNRPKVDSGKGDRSGINKGADDPNEGKGTEGTQKGTEGTQKGTEVAQKGQQVVGSPKQTQTATYADIAGKKFDDFQTVDEFFENHVTDERERAAHKAYFLKCWNESGGNMKEAKAQYEKAEFAGIIPLLPEKKSVSNAQSEIKGTGENSSGNGQKEMPQVRTEKSLETGKSTEEESRALDKFRQLMDQEANDRVMSGIDQKDAGKDPVTKYAESYCRMIIDAFAGEEYVGVQQFWQSVGSPDPDGEAELDDITSQFARGLKENQDVIDKLSQAIRKHICSGGNPKELKNVSEGVISDALKAFRTQCEKEIQALKLFRNNMDPQNDARVLDSLIETDGNKDFVTRYAEALCREMMTDFLDTENEGFQDFWLGVVGADPNGTDDATIEFAKGFEQNPKVFNRLCQTIRKHICDGGSADGLQDLAKRAISEMLNEFRKERESLPPNAETKPKTEVGPMKDAPMESEVLRASEPSETVMATEEETQALAKFKESMTKDKNLRVMDGVSGADSNKDDVTRYAESLCRVMMTDSLDTENVDSQNFWLGIGRADPNGVHGTDDVTIEFVKGLEEGLEQNQKVFNRLSQAIRKHICDGGSANGLQDLAERVISEALNEFRKEREPLPPNDGTKPKTEEGPMRDAPMESEVLRASEPSEIVMATEEETQALAKFKGSMTKDDNQRVMDGVSRTDSNKDEVTRYAESLCHELMTLVVNANNERLQEFWQRAIGADPNGTDQVDTVALEFKEEIGQDQEAFNRFSQAIRQYICDGGNGDSNSLLDLTERVLLDLLKDHREEEAKAEKGLQEIDAEIKQDEAAKAKKPNVADNPKILKLKSELSPEAVLNIALRVTKDKSTRSVPEKWFRAYAQHSVQSLLDNADFWDTKLPFLKNETRGELRRALQTSGWMLDHVENSINGSIDSNLGHEGVQIELKNFIVDFARNFLKAQKSVAGKKYAGANKPTQAESPTGLYPKQAEEKLLPGTVFRQGTNTCPIISLMNAMRMTSQKTALEAKNLITKHSSVGNSWFEFPCLDEKGQKITGSVKEFNEKFGKELEGKQVSLSDFEKAVFVALKKAGLRITKDGGGEALPGDQFEINPVFVLFGFKEPTSSGSKPGDPPTKFQRCLDGQKIADAITAGKPCVVRKPGHFMGIQSVTFDKEGQPTYRCFDSSTRKYSVIKPEDNTGYQFYIGEKP